MKNESFFRSFLVLIAFLFMCSFGLTACGKKNFAVATNEKNSEIVKEISSVLSSDSGDFGSDVSSQIASVVPSVPNVSSQVSNPAHDEESGDSNEHDVYVPKEENIVKDEASGIYYVNNMIIIVFVKATPQATIDGIVSSISGKVVSVDDSINQYQVNIPEKTLAQMESLVVSLEQNESVIFAHYDRAYASEG